MSWIVNKRRYEKALSGVYAKALKLSGNSALPIGKLHLTSKMLPKSRYSDKEELSRLIGVADMTGGIFMDYSPELPLRPQAMVLLHEMGHLVSGKKRIQKKNEIGAWQAGLHLAEQLRLKTDLSIVKDSLKSYGATLPMSAKSVRVKASRGRKSYLRSKPK